MVKIKIDLKHAKNILKVLENFNSLCFEMISIEIKDQVSDEAYKIMSDLMWKYHNANSGPFNRSLKKLIEEKENN